MHPGFGDYMRSPTLPLTFDLSPRVYVTTPNSWPFKIMFLIMSSFTSRDTELFP
jgi:hypothetical protein